MEAAGSLPGWPEALRRIDSTCAAMVALLSC